MDELNRTRTLDLCIFANAPRDLLSWMQEKLGEPNFCEAAYPYTNSTVFACHTIAH
jgi:hypothetical protein